MAVRSKGRIKRFFRSLFLGLLLAIIALAAFSAYTVMRQKRVLQNLEQRIGQLKEEQIPLRFMVLSRSGESVSARFRFYTADGKEIASFERSWNGYELAIDTILVPIGERFVGFPARVFTDAVAPGKGTNLFAYYDRSGFPAIFETPNLGAPERLAYEELFKQVRAFTDPLIETVRNSPYDLPSKWLNGAFGNAVHDIRQLRSFEVGVIYSLVVRSSGGVEIIRE